MSARERSAYPQKALASGGEPNVDRSPFPRPDRLPGLYDHGISGTKLLEKANHGFLRANEEPRADACPGDIDAVQSALYQSEGSSVLAHNPTKVEFSFLCRRAIFKPVERTPKSTMVCTVQSWEYSGHGLPPAARGVSMKTKLFLLLAVLAVSAVAQVAQVKDWRALTGQTFTSKWDDGTVHTRTVYYSPSTLKRDGEIATVAIETIFSDNTPTKYYQIQLNCRTHQYTFAEFDVSVTPAKLSEVSEWRNYQANSPAPAAEAVVCK